MAVAVASGAKLTKRERMKLFFAQLQASGGASNPDEALVLLKSIMDAVEDAHSGFPITNYLERMHAYSFDLGWVFPANGPRYWDDNSTGRHRTYIWDDGRIVIYRMVNHVQTGAPLVDVPAK